MNSHYETCWIDSYGSILKTIENRYAAKRFFIAWIETTPGLVHCLKEAVRVYRPEYIPLLENCLLLM
jgi:hypothetical protein